MKTKQFSFFSRRLLNALGLYKKKVTVAFLGLDNAGKTMLLHVLRDDRIAVHEPTRHAQFEELVIGSVTFKTHDLGGHVAARRLWKSYFSVLDGVVFVVDATDHERFAEAKYELSQLLGCEELAQTPLVVLGNKIDARNAVSEQQLREALGLTETTGKTGKPPVGQRALEVFMCSVVKRAGHADGFRYVDGSINTDSHSFARWLAKHL